MSDPPMNETEEARKRRQKIERQLDDALAASFPASDPIAIVTSNEEEDWGTDQNAPASPETPVQPGSSRRG